MYKAVPGESVHLLIPMMTNPLISAVIISHSTLRECLQPVTEPILIQKHGVCPTVTAMMKGQDDLGFGINFNPGHDFEDLNDDRDFTSMSVMKIGRIDVRAEMGVEITLPLGKTES